MGQYCCAHSSQISETSDNNWGSLFALKESWQTARHRISSSDYLSSRAKTSIHFVIIAVHEAVLVKSIFTHWPVRDVVAILIELVILKPIWRLDILSITCEIALSWIPHNLPDAQSTVILTRQIWGIWKLRPAYSPETPNLGQNRWCFVLCDLEIWWMTLENNRAPLLCCFKLCATFHSHQWIQTGVAVRKCPIWVKFDDF